MRRENVKSVFEEIVFACCSTCGGLDRLEGTYSEHECDGMGEP